MTENKDSVEELLQWKDILEVYPWEYYNKYLGAYKFGLDTIEKIPVYVKLYMTDKGYISISDVRKYWYLWTSPGDGSKWWLLKKSYLKETMEEVTEWELNRLLQKEKWDSDDVRSFSIVRKDKYWKDWIKTTASKFHEIRKQHTKHDILDNIRSWKECIVKFHNAGFESVKRERHEFEWVEVPFTPYHMDLVDIDMDNMVWVWGKFRDQNNIYYLCMGERQWMRLLAKESPKPFWGLKFYDYWTIDFIDKNWKNIECNWKRKAFKIYRNDE